MFVHDKTIVALNALKNECLKYEISSNVDNIGNVCMCFHKGEKLNFFGVAKKFKSTNSGNEIVTFPEMIVLKEIASLNLIVDGEEKLLAYGSGNTLPVNAKLYGLGNHGLITFFAKLSHRASI